MTSVIECPGPLIWLGVGDPEDAAILECPCGYVVVTGNFNNEAHATTPLLRSHR